MPKKSAQLCDRLQTLEESAKAHRARNRNVGNVSRQREHQQKVHSDTNEGRLLKKKEKPATSQEGYR